MASKITKQIKASIRFEAGPATVVKLSSRMIFLKLRVFTGTGFAQPIRKRPKNPSPMSGPKIARPGISRVPIGSTWYAGLRVMRPCKRAVWSPRREAIQAWALSCTQREKRMTTNSKMRMTMSSGTEYSGGSKWQITMQGRG